MTLESKELIPPSMKRFAVVYLTVIVAMIALAAALDIFFNIDIQNASMSIIPALGAALDAGAQFAKNNHIAPDPKYSWYVSRKMLVVELIITLIFAIGFLFFAASAFPELSFPTLLMALAIGLFVQLGLTFLCNRMFFALGAKQQIKAQLKLDQKSQD